MSIKSIQFHNSRFGVSRFVCGAHLRFFALGPRGDVHSECCIDDEHMAVPRANLYLAPTNYSWRKMT